MHLHQQRRGGSAGPLVVFQVRAVCRSDLDELRSRRRHNVGHAERAADLDQLTARDDGFAVAAESAEHKQDGGGIVVDDADVIGAGDVAQQPAHDVVALTSLSAFEFKFQRRRKAQRIDDAIHRLSGQQAAAKIGMNDSAAEIEHAA